MSTPRTLFEKVWSAHEVVPATADTPAVIFIDLHLTHEVTSPQAFAILRERGLKVRRPDLTLATMDHATPIYLFDSRGHFVEIITFGEATGGALAKLRKLIAASQTAAADGAG